jgi:hypothetical protein
MTNVVNENECCEKSIVAGKFGSCYGGERRRPFSMAGIAHAGTTENLFFGGAKGGPNSGVEGIEATFKMCIYAQ